MKRFLFFVLSVLSACTVFATDNVSVTPVTITKGTSVQSNTTKLVFYLESTKQYCALDFHLYIPTDIEVEYYDEDDEEYYFKKALVNDVLNPDNFTLVVKNANSAEYAREGYNTYLVTIYSMDQKKFRNSKPNGELFTLACGTSKDSGVFPIYIEHLTLTVSGTETMPHNVSTSYVKVGSPTSGELKVKGELTPHVLTFINSETAITTLDLSECTAINGDFKLVDKRGVVLPTEELEANVSYTRSTNTWGTICLPFDVKNSETVKYYTLSAVSVAEGKMTFESVEDNDDILAGTPVVYKSSNGELNLSADKLSGAPASSVYTDGFIPKGTFVNTTGTGLYIANNQFWSGTEFTVPAFRTYFYGDPIKGASYRIVVDDEVAGISELEMDENGNLHEVYNLQGQHIAAPINGQVNIIDGKKAIMK